MNKALLIIDIQNDYFPGGAMALEGSLEAGERAGVLLAAARRHSLPVIHVQHISLRPAASFFLAGSRGVEIHESVAPRVHELVIEKHYPNSFRETGLLEKLKTLGIEELVIAGMMSNMCIDATVRAAADLGFSVRLAHDACAARALAFNGVSVPAREVHAAFMAGLQGLYAKLASVEALVEELTAEMRP